MIKNKYKNYKLKNKDLKQFKNKIIQAIRMYNNFIADYKKTINFKDSKSTFFLYLEDIEKCNIKKLKLQKTLIDIEELELIEILKEL